MRRSATVRVPRFEGTQNRDHNKIFQITEWPAAKAEKWGLRMMMTANQGGGSLPMDMTGIGFEGIAIIGINTFLRGSILPETMIPLLDELLECVKIIRNPQSPVATDLLEDDVEEVATRMWLRGEVLSLHLNFSVSAALSALYKKIMIRLPSSSEEEENKSKDSPTP